MSINQSYRRLSQNEAQEILDGVPAIIAKWFGPPLEELMSEENELRYDEWNQELEQSESYLDINHTWQAIHFLLTGEFCFQGESQIEGPLKNLVMGGAPTEIETTYGVAHYLGAPDVAAVAEALQPLTVEIVAPLYNAEAFSAASIYPLRERWNEENGLQQFIREYEHLRAFFIVAARENQAIFITTD